MSSSEQFFPEQFTLDPRVAQDFELDQEVAADITNAIYDHDPALQAGNIRYGLPCVIDPTGRTINHSPFSYRGMPPVGDKGYRFSFALKEAVPTNEIFARTVQEAICGGARRNYTCSKAATYGGVALGEAGLLTPAGLGVFVPNLPPETRGSMIGLTLLAVWWLRNLPLGTYRLHTLNPNSRAYQKRLEEAAAIGSKVLTPVVKAR